MNLGLMVKAREHHIHDNEFTRGAILKECHQQLNEMRDKLTAEVELLRTKKLALQAYLTDVSKHLATDSTERLRH